ncbi:hypothetical protein LCGC14_2677990 [marine sediment metagenome]|uniref:Uncharacterized protein n=1 Tax=marine sediment metagenome TaxID=412755 RepID=A0A0F8ZM89_9ZZZZ
MTKLKFDMDKCMGCGKEFGGNLKKEYHHVYPLFLKPVIEVTIPLCPKCHDRLNDAYKYNPANKELEHVVPNNFEYFKENYLLFRSDFMNKKINRGEFGEKLWANLVNYLECLDSKIVSKKSQRKKSK